MSTATPGAPDGPLSTGNTGGTGLLERERQRVEPGDHERFAHYAPKDKVTEALVMGTPVIALCGKVWVPTRNPDNFPVCPECKEIFNSLPKGPRGK